MAFPFDPQNPRSSTPNNIERQPRILFLDDDHQRADIFLERNPQAVWVETAADCIAKLEETWDEVHLDHDLGGEQYVQHDREDCGMEVVRWLSLSPRPHLQRTRFVVHSHNANGATMMGMQLMVNGYNTEVIPFGESEVVTSTRFVEDEPPRIAPPRPRTLFDDFRFWLLSKIRPSNPGIDPEILERIRANAERRAMALAAKPPEASQDPSGSLGAGNPPNNP